MDKYVIVGSYEGASEVLDQADDRAEADSLASEYRMAFGPGWTIDVVAE